MRQEQEPFTFSLTPSHFLGVDLFIIEVNLSYFMFPFSFLSVYMWDVCIFFSTLRYAAEEIAVSSSRILWTKYRNHKLSGINIIRSAMSDSHTALISLNHSSGRSIKILPTKTSPLFDAEVWKTCSFHCNIGEFDSSNRNTSGDFLYRTKYFAFFCIYFCFYYIIWLSAAGPDCLGRNLNQKGKRLTCYEIIGDFCQKNFSCIAGKVLCMIFVLTIYI